MTALSINILQFANISMACLRNALVFADSYLELRFKRGNVDEKSYSSLYLKSGQTIAPNA